MLNIPALLYKEAESLPLPVRAPENVAAEKEFQQTVKIMRQLIIENNVVLVSLRFKMMTVMGMRFYDVTFVFNHV